MPSAHIPPANPLRPKPTTPTFSVSAGIENLNPNPLLFKERRVHKKRKRPRLTNFAETVTDPNEVQIVRVAKVERGEGEAEVTPAVTPAATPPAFHCARKGKERQKQPSETITIDLTNDEDEKFAPTTNGSTNTPSSQHNHMSPPTPSSNFPTTPLGKIHLPSPRQSHSAGYHRQHQGPRYKVLPAGFGGLELARSHFARERGRLEKGDRDGEVERKVKREVEYSLRRGVEEYWR